MVKRKPHYIKEPFGLPYELTPKGKYRKPKTFKSPRYSMGKGFWAVENDKGERLRLVENKSQLGIHGCGAIKVKEHTYKKICRRTA